MRIQLPDYGVFLHWPQAGVDWVHPDDVDIASELIPSSRVFRRYRFDGTYYHLAYGNQRLRIQPVMWLSVAGEGFDMDQWVEIRGLNMARDPFVGQIVDILYNRRAQEIHYTVRQANMTQSRTYVATELKSFVDRNVLSKSDFQVNRLPIDPD